MDYRGIKFRILRAGPSDWRWQFECDGISRIGTGVHRIYAVRRAKRAIDTAIRGEDRSTWQVGQRVSRRDSADVGTVVEINGKIKVKWDGGRTSYFSHGDKANVEPKPA